MANPQRGDDQRAHRAESLPEAPPRHAALGSGDRGRPLAPAPGLVTWRLAAYALVLGAVCVFLAPITELWWIVPLLGVAGPLLLARFGSRPDHDAHIGAAPAAPEPRRLSETQGFPTAGQSVQLPIAEPSLDDSPAAAHAAGELPEPLDDPLSEREREVLAVLASGRTTSEAARDLFVSVGTVKSHTANIYRKLGAKNRAQAIARARELGLLP